MFEQAESLWAMFRKPADRLDAGQHLFDLLIDLKMRSVLSAKDCCIISYWATLAGAVGVRKIAKAPGDASTGHYSRKFDAGVGMNLCDSRFSLLDVPVFFKPDGSRMCRPMTCLSPQILLDAGNLTLYHTMLLFRVLLRGFPHMNTARTLWL